MYTKVIYPLLLSVSLLLVACGGGDSSSLPTTQAFTTNEKSFVNDLFHTEYLWFDEVVDVDYNSYETPQSLIDALRVTQDKWSFSMTESEYEDMVNQTTAGFGFGYTADFTLYLVRINAPAWGKLQRGDRLLEVNGEAVSQENISQASENLNVTSTFTVLRNGSEVSVALAPSEYSFNVTAGEVLSGNVGYLRYDAFTSTSVAEFETQFTAFKAAGITDLVVDLRYNGGGSVDVASILLSNFTNRYPGERQVYLDWNVNYQSKNSSYYFDEVESNDLDMSRVIFLVTQNSASASEMVISALQPYLGATNVVTIGDVTHGKPVGMNGRSYGSNYYFLINFIVRNDDGVDSPLTGIETTCDAEDDLTHLRGDPEETMLKTALHYIDTGSCL